MDSFANRKLFASFVCLFVSIVIRLPIYVVCWVLLEWVLDNLLFLKKQVSLAHGCTGWEVPGNGKLPPPLSGSHSKETLPPFSPCDQGAGRCDTKSLLCVFSNTK